MKRNVSYTKKGPGRVHRDGRVYREFQWMLRQHRANKARIGGRLSGAVTRFRSALGL